MVCDAAAGGLSRPAHDDDKPRNRTCPQHGALLRNSRHIGGKDNFAKAWKHTIWWTSEQVGLMYSMVPWAAVPQVLSAIYNICLGAALLRYQKR